jgi:hypothetical protein
MKNENLPVSWKMKIRRVVRGFQLYRVEREGERERERGREILKKVVYIYTYITFLRILVRCNRVVSGGYSDAD